MDLVSPNPPGPNSPRAWQTLRWVLDPVGYTAACQVRYGPTFSMRFLLFGQVFVTSNPEDAKRILTDSEHFEGGEAIRRFVEPLIGTTSVLTTSGAEHMRQRKLLLPPMHEGLVGRWAGRIASVAAAELGRLPLGRPVAMRPAMQRITLDVICRMVFGAEDPAELERLREVLARTLDSRLGPLLFFPSVFRWRGRLNPAAGFLRRREEMDRLIAELIATRRRDPALAERDDVLSLLLGARDEDGGGFGERELRDQLMTLLVAGHETTATGLAWALERLSRFPDVQERLVESLDRGEEEYLQATVQEALRLRPPTVNVTRTVRRPVEIAGHRLRPGAPVTAAVVQTQRRADLWPEPLRFRPERFLEEKPVPYSFTPFGGGIRRCIGASLALLEMRTVLSEAIRRFEVHRAPGREERQRLFGAVLVPSRGGRVILRRRWDPCQPD